MSKKPIAAILLAAAASASAASERAGLTIDGRADEPEWAAAQVFGDFVSVQPLTGEPQPADRRVEARLLSLPEGLAVFMKANHPASVPQTRIPMQRDGNEAVDRFNFIVDFDADGRSGYAFTITTAGDIVDRSIARENEFSYDWDARWLHATSNFEGGYAVEYLIPWTIAAMRETTAPDRMIAVYFDRSIAGTGERYAYPHASAERPRFLSDFARIQVAQHRQSLLSVTTYGVLVSDMSDPGQEVRSGADLLWKPGSQRQFAVSINPDFGQVESDELVVNFSTVENLFTDKRPFFTENQSYFDLQHPLGQLFYTRRVGGRADGQSRAADIRLAAKALGSFEKLAYGAFLADESGAAGRRFGLVRTTWGGDGLVAGASLSHVTRPFFDRSATVGALDADWKLGPELTMRPLVMSSRDGSKAGSAAGMVADWDPPGATRHRLSALRADADFELNDLGYQERNDFRSLEWITGLRQDRLPSASVYLSHDWEFEAIHDENDSGMLLSDRFALHRTSPRRDGGFEYLMARWRTPGFDDLLSRGHGKVATRSGVHAYFERHRPRQGTRRWGWYTKFEAKADPVAGYSVEAGWQPEFQLGPHVDFDIGVYLGYQDEWTLWQHETAFGAFDAHRVDMVSNLNWFIDERSELRVKLQAIALSADAERPLLLMPDGDLVPGVGELHGFSVKNLGFQVRYRRELGDAGELFAVYSRGGYAIDDYHRLGDSLSDALGLEQDHQFQLKATYRFQSR